MDLSRWREEERERYVRRVIELWDASKMVFYHSHGFVRNGLRPYFDLLPYSL